MKTIITSLVLATLVALPASAGKDTKQSDHSNNNAPYDCEITKKPGTVKFVQQSLTKDKKGNGIIKISWYDSARAHDVEIKWGETGKSTKTKKVADNDGQSFKGLNNAKTYSFSVRGVSNCGKGSWSKVYKFIP